MGYFGDLQQISLFYFRLSLAKPKKADGCLNWIKTRPHPPPNTTEAALILEIQIAVRGESGEGDPCAPIPLLPNPRPHLYMKKWGYPGPIHRWITPLPRMEACPHLQDRHRPPHLVFR